MYYYANPYVYYSVPYFQPQGYHNAPIGYVPTHMHAASNTSNSGRTQSPFPPVNIQKLDESVRKFQALMKEADLLVDKMGNDPEFSKQLMASAQESNEEKVNQLIKSTGISIKVKTTFTPTGIHIVLDNKVFDGDCCDLLIALRW